MWLRRWIVAPLMFTLGLLMCLMFIYNMVSNATGTRTTLIRSLGFEPSFWEAMGSMVGLFVWAWIGYWLLRAGYRWQTREGPNRPVARRWAAPSLPRPSFDQAIRAGWLLVGMGFLVLLALHWDFGR